jgi:hypothetical protein
MRNPKSNGKLFEGLFRWHGWFSGPEPNSKCLLRLYANKGKIYAIGQQLRPPAGTSITNDVENLASLVFEICKKEYGLTSIEDFKWIEFYPKECNLVWKDQYDLVHMKWDGERYYHPEWERVNYQIVRVMIGGEPPKSLLREEPYFFIQEERAFLLAVLERNLPRVNLLGVNFYGRLNQAA